MTLTETVAKPKDLRSHYLLVAGFSMLCGLTSCWLVLGRDQGIGLYIADVLRTGGAPYKDAWEIRPPGIFYIYAAAISAFGKTALALRLLDLITHTLTALALVHLGRRLYSESAGLWAGLLYPAVYFLGNDFWNLGNTDGSVALPSVLALCCVLEHRRGSRSAWDFGAGLLMGVVFLVRFTQGLIYLPVLALIFASQVHARPYGWTPRIFRLALITAGFLLINGLFVLHMHMRGALGDFLYTLFVFAPKYAVLTYDRNWTEFLRSIAGLHFFFTIKYALVTVPALLACSWIAVRERSAFGLAGILWLLSALLGMEVMAKYYAYHWLPLFAPLALMAGWFFGQVMRSLRTGRRVIGIAGLVILAYCVGSFAARFGPVAVERFRDAVSLSLGTQTQSDYLRKFDTLDRGSDFSATANYRSAEYLRQHTQPGDPVFVWGFETLIYYLADRNPPTRFCSNYPIVAKWHRQDWYEELVEQIKTTRPVYILLVSRDAMPWITGHGLDSLSTLKRNHPELRDFISENYDLETTIENIHLCRYKGAPPPPAKTP